jgi:hypothetical protein
LGPDGRIRELIIPTKSQGKSVVLEWDGDGKLKTHLETVGRTPWGRVVECARRDLPTREFFMNDWVLEGPYREYDGEGRLRMEGFYAQGKKVGVWLNWDQNGRLMGCQRWQPDGTPAPIGLDRCVGSGTQDTRSTEQLFQRVAVDDSILRYVEAHVMDVEQICSLVPEQFSTVLPKEWGSPTDFMKGIRKESEIVRDPPDPCRPTIPEVLTRRSEHNHANREPPHPRQGNEVANRRSR